MSITLADAIQTLRADLRKALATAEPDIIFIPGPIEIELAVTFAADTLVKGGIKAYIFSASAEAKDSETTVHRVKLSLSATNNNGEPLKLKASLPSGLSQAG